MYWSDHKSKKKPYETSEIDHSTAITALVKYLLKNRQQQCHINVNVSFEVINLQRRGGRQHCDQRRENGRPWNPSNPSTVASLTKVSQPF